MPEVRGRDEDTGLGLRHAHKGEAASTIGELRRAQRSMHWDTGTSRVIYVEVCQVCGEHDRQSIKECAQPECQEHRICETRFR
jgi:predicted Zn-ribbon and HTH transcriptional regulator